MMDAKFEKILRRARNLGNHHRKYIFQIEQNIDPLLMHLEQAMMLDRVHLIGSPISYKEEVKLISGLADSVPEKLQDLGCYFALHFLQMNLSALDALKLEIMTCKTEPTAIFRNFMLQVGHDFRKLTAAYMEQLLQIFLPLDRSPEYIFLGVGTRSDQDDIDIGVVDRGDEEREVLNQAISRMSSEMFKKAICLHFHLSEHVGSPQSFSASIDEYRELLNKEIHDFVIITEMLGAARIIGSRKLFSDFRRLVTMRYYYNPNDASQTKFHEGYLRGIVGEVRSLYFREFLTDTISPKTDGLRMIKAGLYAAKTIFNLRQVNAWLIVDTLKQRDRKRLAFYEELEKPLTFLETFRYLYQLLIGQEEEILLSQPHARDNIALVAEMMGYESVGGAQITDFFLTDYYKNVMSAKETIQQLMPSVIHHLTGVTVFGKLLRHKRVTMEGERRLGNLAVRFLKETRFFKGTRFWDDIIRVLEQKDGRVLKRLVGDLCSLSPTQQEQVLEGLCEWAWNSFVATFQFLTLLHRYRESLPDYYFFEKFNVIFFHRMRGTEEEARRLSIVFKFYPKLLHDYISLLNDKQRRKFAKWLDSEIWDRVLIPSRNRLQYLLKLHYGTSKYFKRVMNTVLQAYPEYINYLDQPQRLGLIAQGHFAEVERASSAKSKLKRLLDYHHFEFFRVCLQVLTDTPSMQVASEFTEFSDNYLRTLFDTCKQDCDERREVRFSTRDLLGVFVTGGHGHMLAFDDDYDLIVLLDSNDTNLLDYSNGIMSRMHQELVKTGCMPHYRLSDYTSSYVCTFQQLKELLDSSPHPFIDMSQLLGARMIVGSAALLRSFEQSFIIPYAFEQSDNYARQMIDEVRSRHASFYCEMEDGINIKESPGGLRDIEMLLLICRAVFHIREHSNFKLLLLLSSRNPIQSELFQDLYNQYEFLRKIRNLNRLMIAADDVISFEHLDSLTENLLKTSPESLSRGRNLAKQIGRSTAQVKKNIDIIFDQLVIPQLDSGYPSLVK
ncbi:hypothetical protein JW992_15340 [candidate division KSB1 bacterium]|nr:hypothetical protein [candidate division KSB1 bacterium]